MFEYIWAHKYIVNGIVFNVNNFSNPLSYIPPSMYSYKIALDYLFRNIIDPFEKEYGIYTPYIMMDGRENITRPEHLYELSEIVNEPMNRDKRGLLMIVDALFDGHLD